MMTSRRDILKWALAAATAEATLPIRYARAGALPLAIIVSERSPLQRLTKFELKKLYLGARLTDPEGERIVPFNQAAKSPDRVAFEDEVLEMGPEQAASYWIDRKIRGQSSAPKAVGTAELVQRVVSKIDNAIAYVRLDQVRSDVRLVAIDGKLPTDAAYQILIGRTGMLRVGGG